MNQAWLALVYCMAAAAAPTGSPTASLAPSAEPSMAGNGFTSGAGRSDPRGGEHAIQDEKQRGLRTPRSPDVVVEEELVGFLETSNPVRLRSPDLWILMVDRDGVTPSEHTQVRAEVNHSAEAHTAPSPYGTTVI
jgi:hypothetical protein